MKPKEPRIKPKHIKVFLKENEVKFIDNLASEQNMSRSGFVAMVIRQLIAREAR